MFRDTKIRILIILAIPIGKLEGPGSRKNSLVGSLGFEVVREFSSAHMLSLICSQEVRETATTTSAHEKDKMTYGICIPDVLQVAAKNLSRSRCPSSSPVRHY